MRKLTSTWTAWQVTLTVTQADGQQASTSQTVQFRDLLIASLGDSAASGEGDPDVPAGSNATWANNADAAACDRSGWAATAQAALQIQNTDRQHTSVTFWHLACAGAPIVDGLLPPASGPAYQGQNPNGTPLQGQVPQLAGLVKAAGRPLDALLITAGADDVDWTKTVEACYWQNAAALGIDLFTLGLATVVEDGLSSIGLSPCIVATSSAVASHLSQLPHIVDELAAALPASIVAPDHVFLTEYWDPTVDNRRGTYDWKILGSAGPGFSWYCQRDPIAPVAYDRMWGETNIVQQLNGILQTAAGREGWQWVGNIASQFTGGNPAGPNGPGGHGVCATPGENWVNSVFDSFSEEGDIDGSWHANPEGQAVVEAQLFLDLTTPLGLNTLPTPPAISDFALDTADTDSQSLLGLCAGSACPPDSTAVVPGATVDLGGSVDGIVGPVGPTTVQFGASAGQVAPSVTVQPIGNSGFFDTAFTAPSTAGVATVTATAANGGGASPPVSISITVAPEVSAVSPDRGVVAGGTRVTVSGAGFGRNTQVYFGGALATHVNVVAPNTITAVTPRTTSSRLVFVTVTSGGIASVSPGAPASFTYFVPSRPFLLPAGGGGCGNGATSVLATVWGPPNPNSGTAAGRAGAAEPHQRLAFTLSGPNNTATSAVFGNGANQIIGTTGVDGTVSESVTHAELNTVVAASNLSKGSTGVAHTPLPGYNIPCALAATSGQIWNVHNGVPAFEGVSPAIARKMGLPHVDNFTVAFQTPTSVTALSGLRLSLTMPTDREAAAVASSGIDATVLSAAEERAQVDRISGVQVTAAMPTRLTDAAFVGPVLSVGRLSGPARLFDDETRITTDKRLHLTLPYSSESVKAGDLLGIFWLDTAVRPARWTNAGVHITAMTTSTVTAEVPHLSTFTVIATDVNGATNVAVTAGPFSRAGRRTATVRITATLAGVFGTLSRIPLRFATTDGSLSELAAVNTNAHGIATDTLTLASGAAVVSASVLGLPTMVGTVTVVRTGGGAVQAAPRVGVVFPHTATIEAGLRRGFQITGAGFANATQVRIGRVVLRREEACSLGGAGCFAVVGDTEIVADGGDLTPGTYDVRVAGPYGESAVTRDSKVELTSG